jgi:hypothetical protein
MAEKNNSDMKYYAVLAISLLIGMAIFRGYQSNPEKPIFKITHYVISGAKLFANDVVNGAF